jgi:predicted component of type VI protein secretion system
MPRVTITVPGGSPQPYRFQLDHKLVTIGRLDENDIQVDSSSVSSRHAEMARSRDGFELRDLGSTNGIKLDGKLVSHVALRDGMKVELGEVVFGFELSPEERAVLDMQSSVQMKPEPVEKNVLPTPQPSFSAPKAPPAARPAPVVIQSSSGGGGFFLIVLALIAFCFGMALRFKNDTGRSWVETVLSRYISREAAAPAGK